MGPKRPHRDHKLPLSHEQAACDLSEAQSDLPEALGDHPEARRHFLEAQNDLPVAQSDHPEAPKDLQIIFTSHVSRNILASLWPISLIS